jgi:Mg2+-importing ATPase
VTFAIILPFTTLGRYFGFVALPLDFYVLLLGMNMVYLVFVQGAKMFFYRGM